MIPLATSPTTLSRPTNRPRVLASTARFRYPARRQELLIHLNAVVASSTFTSLHWSLQSVTGGDGVENATVAPLADDRLDPSRTYNAIAASGPRLTPTGAGSAPLRTRTMTTRLRADGELECLCNDLRLWAAALQNPRQQASVVSNLAALPNGTTSVDVVLPGLATLRRIPVTRARDGTAFSAGPVRRTTGTWTYALSDPPTGWASDEWPTPVPRSSQLPRYVATVDTLLR